MATNQNALTDIRTIQNNIVLNRKTLAQPPYFLPLTDPFKRVWTGTIADSAPVVTFVPGALIAKVASDDDSEAVALQEKLAEEIQRGYEEGNEPDERKLNDYIAAIKKANDVSSPNTNRVEDPRFFSFEEKPIQFSFALTNQLSFMSSRMSSGSSYFFPVSADIPPRGKWGGVQFFVDSDTSITESFSNEYTDSMAESAVDALSNMAKQLSQAWQILSTSNSNNQSFSEEAGSIASNAGGGVLSATLGGANVTFPKMWSESTLTRNYNLTIKLETPYCDVTTVYEEVLVPYVTLLTMTLPLQTHDSAYRAPFVHTIDSPGWFSIQAGVITEMTVNRFPEEGVRAIHGISSKIECSLTIIDLYPALMLNQGAFSTKASFGLNRYIASMVGIGYEKLGTNQWGAGIRQNVARMVLNVDTLPQAASDQLKADYKELLSFFPTNWFTD